MKKQTPPYIQNPKYAFLILSIMITYSCELPFQNKNKGPLKYSDPAILLAEQRKQQQAKEQKQREFLENRKKLKAQLEEEKKVALAEITSVAAEQYKSNVESIFKNKCMNCHDSSFKMPFYGKVFPKINPVHQHQEDGLKALNFEKGYPFIAKGNPPVISLLKAIKTATEEKSMPIKSFLRVYPKKALTAEEEDIILNWVNPLIEKIQSYEAKYNNAPENPSEKAADIFANSCIRCHGNGNTKGGFGDIENLKSVLKSKYVDLKKPDESKLLKVIEDGSMPPGKLDKLSAEEIQDVRNWIILKK